MCLQLSDSFLGYIFLLTFENVMWRFSYFIECDVLYSLKEPDMNAICISLLLPSKEYIEDIQIFVKKYIL